MVADKDSGYTNSDFYYAIRQLNVAIAMLRFSCLLHYKATKISSGYRQCLFTGLDYWIGLLDLPKMV